MGGKTGCLAVSDGEAHGEIFLDGGRVSWAEVHSSRDHFAEKLVKRGRITRSQLDTAIGQRDSAGDRPLGHILVDSGHVERDEMVKLLRIQSEEAVYALFGWKQGQFTFVSGRRPPYHAFAISLDAENLLLEGARRVDEWDLIRRKVPSFDLVYRRSGSSLGVAAADLTENQDRILPLLDGTRDVASIVDVTGLSEYDVGKALYGLLMAGFATLLERRSRVRHLEYRELLAYMVREAEFADAERRKDAARHIADCPSCGRRLRSIHVRRTEGSGIIALPVETAEAEAQDVDLDLAQAAGGETAGFVAGRIQDRREAPDRRATDRRRGIDRRRTQDPAWLKDHQDRRTSARRVGERRAPQGRHRRSDDYQRGGSQTVITSGIPMPSAGGASLAAARGQTAPMAMPRRVTEVRHAVPQRRPVQQPPAPPEAPPSPETAATEEKPAAAAPTPAPVKPEPPAANAPPRPADIRPAKRRSNPAAPRASSSEIVWLTSPEETKEMLRRESEARTERKSGSYTPHRPSRITPSRPSTPALKPPSSPSELAPLGVPEVPLTIPLARAPRRTTPRLTETAAKRRTWRNRLIAAAGVGVLALAASYGAMAIWGNPPNSLSATAITTAFPTNVSPHPSLPSNATLRITEPAPESAAAGLARVPEPVSVAPKPTVAAAAAAIPGATVAATDARAAAAAADKVRRDSIAAARRDSVALASRERHAVAVAPLAPDSELAAGGWTPISRTEAAAVLGGTLAQITGLKIESITTSSVGGRPRVRVAQIAPGGHRVALVEMSSGSPAAGSRPYRAADVSASAAEGMSIGTATLGGAFITARSGLGAEDLRQLLLKLGEVR